MKTFKIVKDPESEFVSGLGTVHMTIEVQSESDYHAIPDLSYDGKWRTYVDNRDIDLLAMLLNTTVDALLYRICSGEEIIIQCGEKQ